MMQLRLEREVCDEMREYAERLGPAMVHYWNYHKDRFLFETVMLEKLVSKMHKGQKLKLLDIGPSFQTLLFQRCFPTQLAIDTFGFADPKFPPPTGQRHISFDLNDAYYPEKWPALQG